MMTRTYSIHLNYVRVNKKVKIIVGKITKQYNVCNFDFGRQKAIKLKCCKFGDYECRTTALYCVQRNAKGQDLVDKVCEYLNLLEKDYFALSYKDNVRVENKNILVRVGICCELVM